MMRLRNETQNRGLVPNLRVADSTYSRMRGLLGTQTLPEGEALWIPHCNNIHTFFMNYAIDCVFLDRDLKISALVEDVKPWRMVVRLKSSSVIEMPTGTIAKLGLRVGDQLHVGS